MLVCRHTIAFWMHLVLNKVTAFATRDKVMMFDWVVEGTVFVSMCV